jgi:hypothetical protein
MVAVYRTIVLFVKGRFKKKESHEKIWHVTIKTFTVRGGG